MIATLDTDSVPQRVARTRRVLAVPLLSLTGILAACGGSNSGAAVSPSSGPTTMVPAGVQFDSKPGKPAAIATLDPTTLPASGQGAPPGCVGGTPKFRNAAAVVASGSNKVAVATRFLDNLTGGSYDAAGSSKEAALWHSTDGATWTWVDLRPVIGNVQSTLTVSAVDGGFIAVGGVLGSCGFGAPSTAIVLLSADGLNWTKAASLGRPFSVEATTVVAVGSNLLLAGSEYICDSGGGNFNVAAHDTQTRYWRSADKGHTWAEVPIASISVLKDPTPPANQGGCPGVYSNTSFGTPTPWVSVVDGKAAVFAFDGSSLATSTDLVTWTPSTLPGAVPAGVSAEFQENPYAAALVHVGSDTVAVILTPRYDASRKSYFLTGAAIQAWRTTDGSTFTALPAGRPLDIEADLSAAQSAPIARLSASFQVVGNAVELDTGDAVGPLRFNPKVAAGALETVSVAYRSVAGPLEDWQHCNATAAAFCRFSSLGSASLTGAKLAGIDLDSADLGSADLSGADLSGANLSHVVGYKAKLATAVLAHAKLAGANFAAVDLTGVDLTGADLTGTFVDPTFAKAKLSGATLTKLFVSVPQAGAAGLKLTGLDLNHAVFISSNGTAPLTGADFSGAKLDGANFQRIDLTGASFTGASLSGVSFSTVTCPDGKPSDSSLSGAAQCRL